MAINNMRTVAGFQTDITVSNSNGVFTRCVYVANTTATVSLLSALMINFIHQAVHKYNETNTGK